MQEPKLSVETYHVLQVAAGQTPDDEVSRTITGEVIRETPHFQIYAEKSFVPVNLDWLQVEVENIYDYLVERMGVSTTERFALTFRPPDTAPCPKRGLAHSFEPVGQAVVFANEQTSRSQISGVLAHEFAHLLHSRALRAGTSDTNLSEGLASWAAGKYWQAWQGTAADNVRAFRVEGRYKPLEEYSWETPPETDIVSCWKNRDRRYNSWAAFIDFLITEYGMDKFRQLLGPPEATPSKLFVMESGSIDWRQQTLNGLIMREHAIVQGTVFGEDGKPASGITVTISRRDSRGDYKVNTKDGKYSYDDLPAGEYIMGVIYNISTKTSANGDAGLLRDATLRTGRLLVSDFDLKEFVSMGKPGSFEELENQWSKQTSNPPQGVGFSVVPVPPATIDYKAVYGMTLSELEKTWLDRLDKKERR
ncbi:MAG TPA: carboxypeptidase-like regulatory domain-containing protein [Terriglobia bacterium]|nr:carboxypeptidase-like regulatory domain-containing protein [Terriglobia bacterium]